MHLYKVLCIYVYVYICIYYTIYIGGLIVYMYPKKRVFFSGGIFLDKTFHRAPSFAPPPLPFSVIFVSPSPRDKLPFYKYDIFKYVPVLKVGGEGRQFPFT